MQYSDVSRHDWHAGQILCILPTRASQAHAFLIDFSVTTQSDLDFDLSTDDYGQCVSVIAQKDITGLDPKWVCEYWDRDDMKRESWDTHEMTITKEGFVWSSKAADPYEFVYEGLD